MNHNGLCLWICAFLGSVVMFPELHGKDASAIRSLPTEERCKHLGRMVLLPARTTEPEHGGDAMECSIYASEGQHSFSTQPDFKWAIGDSIHAYSRHATSSAQRSREGCTPLAHGVLHLSSFTEMHP